MIEPLEILAIASRTGKAFDPREPRGTRPSYTLQEVLQALSGGDWMGEQMALFVAAGHPFHRRQIAAHLESHVLECCQQDGITPDVEKVVASVQKAMQVGQLGGPSIRGGSRYFRWAYGELMGKAMNTANNMARRLFRE